MAELDMTDHCMIRVMQRFGELTYEQLSERAKELENALIPLSLVCTWLDHGRPETTIPKALKLERIDNFCHNLDELLASYGRGEWNLITADGKRSRMLSKRPRSFARL